LACRSTAFRFESASAPVCGVSCPPNRNLVAPETRSDHLSRAEAGVREEISRDSSERARTHIPPREPGARRLLPSDAGGADDGRRAKQTFGAVSVFPGPARSLLGLR